MRAGKILAGKPMLSASAPTIAFECEKEARVHCDGCAREEQGVGQAPGASDRAEPRPAAATESAAAWPSRQT